LARGAKLLALTTDGKLSVLAEKHGAPVWQFEHKGQPRAAVGLSFMLSLAALVKLGLVPNKSADVAEAVAAMRAQQASLHAEIPAAQNPAKRLAGQLLNRVGMIFASDYLAPVARRWKGQFTEVAKAVAVFDELPEMDHNTIVGTVNPQAQLSNYFVVFLRSGHDHPRNHLRAEVTREIYMKAGFNTDVIEAQGQSPLAHMLTALHFGDYTSYYLALAYGIDPSPIPQIDFLKEQLAKR